MPRKKRSCTVEGCDGAHVGRGYCMRHYQQMRYHGKLQPIRERGRRILSEPEVRDLSSYVMVSACHGASVTEGAQHEYGKQYCTKCSEACLWSYRHKRDVSFT